MQQLSELAESTAIGCWLQVLKTHLVPLVNNRFVMVVSYITGGKAYKKEDSVISV